MAPLPLLGAAMVGAGGVARAGILVTAAARTAAFSEVGRSLTGLAGKTLALNLAFTGLSKAFGLLQSRAGLVAAGLTATGAALQTAQWLDYNETMRVARLQFAALGVDTESANKRLDALRRILGRTATKELVESTEAVRLLALETDPGLTRSILEFSNLARNKLGREVPGLTEALFLAFRNDFDPINAMFRTTIKNIPEMQLAMERMTKSLEQESLPNITRTGQALEDINETVGPVVGKFNDLGAAIPRVALEAMARTLASLVKNFRALLLLLSAAYVGAVIGAPLGPLGMLGGALIATGLMELLMRLFQGGRPKPILPEDLVPGAPGAQTMLPEPIVPSTPSILDTLRKVLSILPGQTSYNPAYYGGSVPPIITLDLTAGGEGLARYVIDLIRRTATMVGGFPE